MQRQTPCTLHIELLSDSTFSRGEGTAGVVDTEVEHDELGLPFIGGKTIRGLLRDAWLSMCKHFEGMEEAAARVLGRSRAREDSCRLRIGDAHLPEGIRNTVRNAVATEKRLAPDAILAAFTDVRYQTAEDPETGAPATATLRSSRVILRQFTFEAPLTWLDGYEPNPKDLQVLALCALATRHGGLLRNRGRGHICITLDGQYDATRRYARRDDTEGNP